MSDWISSLSQGLAAQTLLLPGQEVWIFGCGGYGRDLAKAGLKFGLKVRGFVQSKPEQRCVDELPVRSWGELQAADLNYPLLIGIHNCATPLDGLVQLAKAAGFQTVVNLWSSYVQLEAWLGWRYWLASPQYLVKHADDLRRIHSRLADDASRLCLERVVAFRMGLDLGYSSFRHEMPQYFNEITLPEQRSTPVRYLDGGAYNGDSLQLLLKHAPVECAWLFEPDVENYTKLTQNVRSLQLRSYCLPLALSDRYALLHFAGDQGASAHINHAGTHSIATVAIDDFLCGERIDLIKLDIEGAEAAALQGAGNTLRNSRPVLAISAYHRPDDLWVLPDLIDSICSGYRFYLRQHTYNSFDLVLYGVANE